MAISSAQLVKDLLPGLNDLFEREYEKVDNPAWAVYFTHPMRVPNSFQVHEVVPWKWGKHRERSGLVKVYAKDEMDAYMQVMKRMNGG